MIRQLAQENIVLLQQGIDLVRQLNDAQFRYEDDIARSSIGKHLRHILDFYTAFFRNMPASPDELHQIDYDRRHRDPVLETERPQLCRKAEDTQLRLAKLERDSLAEVASCEGLRNFPSVAKSHRTRELQFLLGHTVHHYALITMTLRLQQLEVPKDFGIACSTRLYLQNQA
ncbi:DinB family protein [Candidatus Haliotispira prima]|uniref:DinB family protein n=1 Tax=Candidatus Haliotispira prima TaxID=3034016 RepID=A0ABY8MG66_9SPIO|nr:DinB family protein [Candidatus Haliotispira prima]